MCVHGAVPIPAHLVHMHQEDQKHFRSAAQGAGVVERQTAAHVSAHTAHRIQLQHTNHEATVLRHYRPDEERLHYP